MARDFQTPFTNPIAPTPSGAQSGSGGTSGGYDFPGGRKESSNMSGLPALPTTVSLPEAPGADASVPMPQVESPGTFK
jgi:hypothetical protein